MRILQTDHFNIKKCFMKLLKEVGTVIKTGSKTYHKVFLAFSDFIWMLLWQYIFLYTVSTKLSAFQVQRLLSAETIGAVYQTSWNRAS